MATEEVSMSGKLRAAQGVDSQSILSRIESNVARVSRGELR